MRIYFTHRKHYSHFEVCENWQCAQIKDLIRIKELKKENTTHGTKVTLPLYKEMWEED